MKKLSASILSADFGRLAEQVHLVEQAGADWIHVDVMDGHFVPNITIGPDVVKAIRKATTLPLDVHLMIDNPQLYLKHFVDAGADWLGIHVEATVHLERLIQNIKELGVKATATLNPATPLNSLDYVLKDLDMVLLMSVNPGFSGQKFIRGVLPKLQQLRNWIDLEAPEVLIEVDGGVATDTVAEIVAAGADVLVSGSGIFGRHGGYAPGEAEDDARRLATNLRRLRELML